LLCGFLDFPLLCVWFCILRSWVSLEWTWVHSLTFLMGCRIGVVYWTWCAINHACLCCDKLKVWYFSFCLLSPSPTSFFFCVFDWTCRPESKVMWIYFVPNNKPAVLSFMCILLCKHLICFLLSEVDFFSDLLNTLKTRTCYNYQSYSWEVGLPTFNWFVCTENNLLVPIWYVCI